MEHGSVFNSDQGQAVSLPETAALPEDVKIVDVVALGRARVITPAGQSWDSWFDAGEVTADFMVEREQPEGR